MGGTKSAYAAATDGKMASFVSVHFYAAGERNPLKEQSGSIAG